jgi:DNA-binding LacI/PurR family transcriptional regulator
MSESLSIFVVSPDVRITMIEKMKVVAPTTAPPLSTGTQDAKGAGEALVEALIEAIEQGAAKSRVLPVRLTVRESSRSA